MTEYTAATSNATNKVTATAADETAVVTIELDGTEIENGSSPSWAAGENELTITVTDGEDATLTKVYTVTVTKS